MGRLYDWMTVDFFHEDEKGRLLQLVHEGFGQFNVITSKAGVSRGGHYHKDTEEAFFIIDGTMKVRLYLGEKAETVTLTKNDFFVIHPFVTHYMDFPEGCMMIAMYTTPVEREDGSKDIHNGFYEGNIQAY